MCLCMMYVIYISIEAQAREENRQRISRIQELDDIVHEMDDITSDGEITSAEMATLKNRLVMLERRMLEQEK